ncbi:hypothetical protein B8W69_06575 [Mycobacterium vulneris]|uniref:Uncharacterized protein n=1 Tax=Mycolicibacterium vulneris TaxID=547163 RepID=A0A1X2L9R2_9MYCO|nr:hypothetical protein B8W69_06575 [Mycolicibacterium vulneris]
MERAVIEELETLPKTVEFAGIAAAARAVAAAIDDPAQRSYISRNGNTLQHLLEQLRGRRKKINRQLAVVQAQAGRRRAAQ